MDHTQPAAVSSESTWVSPPGCQVAAPSVVIQSEPAVLQAYPTSAEANRMCAAPAGGSAAIPKDGAEVFQQTCCACHGQGIAGAPKAGDRTAWAPRIAKGKALLYQHALQGFQGSAGVMPPKGGRTDLSDDLIKAAVDHMVGMAQ